MIKILYQDEFLAVVNKPHNLLMHLSSIARDIDENIKDMLELQLDKKVFLVHRLDRKTAGALVIAFDSVTAQEISQLFIDKSISKVYWAIARGHFTEEIEVNKALENENGNMQDATTFFKPLKTTSIEVSTGKYSETRLSLIECYPKTGRMHQIRRHLAHLRHYIINDKPHGDCKVNKVFKDKLDFNHMMLHAKQIEFTHPKTKQKLRVEAPLFEEFERMLELF